MSTQERTCPCTHCEKTVPFHYARVNHLQHLWLTLFTLGLWFPIWLFEILGRTRICDVCGKPVK
ncbi:MAG TPA: hypothetical protein PLO37_19565 [Candidatus Hydrogenedentes bacterium]|nr:hypothetical protein [Candidatus Hydrogenedentota bacterium]HPG69052.1 hypothetical protein [Candidatus Hydrogenedentota bacterium]